MKRVAKKYRIRFYKALYIAKCQSHIIFVAWLLSRNLFCSSASSRKFCLFCFTLQNLNSTYNIDKVSGVMTNPTMVGNTLFLLCVCSLQFSFSAISKHSLSDAFNSILSVIVLLIFFACLFCPDMLLYYQHFCLYL